MLIGTSYNFMIYRCLGFNGDYNKIKELKVVFE